METPRQQTQPTKSPNLFLLLKKSLNLGSCPIFSTHNRETLPKHIQTVPINPTPHFPIPFPSTNISVRRPENPAEGQRQAGRPIGFSRPFGSFWAMPKEHKSTTDTLFPLPRFINQASPILEFQIRLLPISSYPHKPIHPISYFYRPANGHQ